MMKLCKYNDLIEFGVIGALWVKELNLKKSWVEMA